MGKQKVLITGVNGFVGKHLSQELNKQTYEVSGLGQEPVTSNEIECLLEQYYGASLLNENVVNKLPLSSINSIIHLAGLAAVGPSFDQPLRYINDNCAMLINLAESALKQGVSPRFIVVSSGAVYSPKQDMPLTEQSIFGFTSPYAVSKIAVENLAQYYQSRGLDMIIVRPFNHIGPGQGEGFLLPDLTKQVRESIDNNYEINVGNLSTSRDYTDVRDVVKAYTLLATQDDVPPGIYNVCSGKAVSGNEMLRILAKEILGDNSTKLKVTVDPAKVRPVDADLIVGDNSKLRSVTGWEPTYTLEQTIKDFIKSR